MDKREECELQRLRNTIAKFKEYDKRRTKYLRSLEEQVNLITKANEQLNETLKQKEEDIENLLQVINDAKPLILHPKEKAYLYDLIMKVRGYKNLKQKADKVDRLNEEIRKHIKDKKELKELNKALKQQIKILGNGNKA